MGSSPTRSTTFCFCAGVAYETGLDPVEGARFPHVGSIPTRSTISQGREEVTHQTHTLETAGSIPAPAPINPSEYRKHL